MLNLCFHGVGTPGRALEPGEADYWIGPELLAGVLDLVHDRDDVRLSFDDGNESDATVALPALQERGLVAEFFVLAGRLDQPGSLSTGQLRDLASAGMRIGSHGMHHRSWRGCVGDAAVEEFVTARQMIAGASGAMVKHAACPRGEYDRRALGSLKRAGYAHVMTSDRAPATAGRWLQPRYSILAGDSVASVAALLDRRPGTGARTLARARILAKSMR